MIILTPDDPSKQIQPEMVQVRTLDQPDTTYPPETPPPYSSSGPSYSSDEPQNYESIEEQASRDSRTARRKRRKILRRVLWIPSFLVSLLLLTIAGPVLLQREGWYIGIIGRVDLPFHNPRPHRDHTELPAGDKDHKPSATPVPTMTDVSRSFCFENASWSETVTYSESRIPYFSAHASFQIPANSERLLLVSQAAHSSGRLQILDSAIPDEIVRVYVTMRYYDPQSKNDITACLMERFPGETGIGLFPTSAKDGSNVADTIDFDVVVLFPPNATPKTPQYYNLEASLPKFGYGVATQAHFKSFSIESAGMPLTFESLYAEDACIMASNASISGVFNIANSLFLTTSEYPINAEVTLSELEGPSCLEMRNTNAPVHSSVKLVSTGSNLDSKFDLEISGENAPMNISITEVPLDANLQLKLVTSQEPASLALPETYEGEFLLISSVTHTPVVLRRDDEDTKRRVWTEKQDGKLKGSIARVQHDEGVTLKNRVYVRTLDTSNTLIL